MRGSSVRQPLLQIFCTAAGFVFATAILTITTVAQPPAQTHYQHNVKRGPAPNGVEQATFFVHRLGRDHAEGLTTLEMNGDGRPDIVSGAYWYENRGPEGGEWKRYQCREVGFSPTRRLVSAWKKETEKRAQSGVSLALT
jgi:hypothetical protein